MEAAGLEARKFESVPPLLARARRVQPRLCVVGPQFADEKTVGRLRGELPFTDVIVWAPDGGPGLVRAALLAGARDVVLTGEEDAVGETARAVIEEQKLLPRVLEHEQREDGAFRFEGLLSRSQKMWDVFETCIRTAATRAPVLILGETGTGKELVARGIHRRSHRSGRFVALNCGAVPETLIDSELFGHEEGAFTGAADSKEGLFRHADGGTLFLDEIGAIPLNAQYSLLRALQEGAIRPVGSSDEVPVDVRVIAATSTPLISKVQEEEFREDLLYRIDVIRVIIPALRDRPEDIVFLYGHFAQQLADHYKVERPEVSDDFLDALQAHEWPGNVRELENFTERLLLTHPGERVSDIVFRRLMQTYHGREEEEEVTEDLAGDVDKTFQRPVSGMRGAVVDIDRPLPEVTQDAVENVERAWIETALRATGGRVGATAARAGISRRTLLRKMIAYGIDKRRFRGG